MALRITIEELTSDGWRTVSKTTKINEFKQFMSLTKLAKLLNLSRGQFRYRYEKD